MQIMNPLHPRWTEFMDKLCGPTACNFSETAWICNNSTECTFARIILSTFDNIDVDEFIRYFHMHGGHCDCEIVFNVEDSVRRQAEKAGRN